MSTEVSAGAATRSLKRSQVRLITVFRFLGMDVGWYGIAGFIALVSAPVLYPVFRSVFGGPAGPSREAGDDALVLAKADAAEDAGEASGAVSA
jgi:hypothetical protein